MDIWLVARVDTRPRTTSEVDCVFIIPSSIQINLFAIITLSLEVVRVLAMLTSLPTEKSAAYVVFRKMALGCDHQKAKIHP